MKINDSGNLHSGISVVEHMSKGEAPGCQMLRSGMSGGDRWVSKPHLCSSSKLKWERLWPRAISRTQPGSRASRPETPCPAPTVMCVTKQHPGKAAWVSHFAHSFRKPMENKKVLTLNPGMQTSRISLKEKLLLAHCP